MEHMYVKPQLLIEGYRLDPTCFACPEQYDVYDQAGTQVAYIRLRHGNLTVSCPDYGGIVVYSANPRGDGVFDSTERMHHLKIAIAAIQEWVIFERYKIVDED